MKKTVIFKDDYDKLVGLCSHLSYKYSGSETELNLSAKKIRSLEHRISKLQDELLNPSVKMLDKFKLEDIEKYIRSKKLSNINKNNEINK